MLLDGSPDGAGRDDRALARLHEHVDHPVAPQAPAPYRLVVGGEVEVDQARLSMLHDVGRCRPHVVFETPAADGPDRPAAFGDQQPGSLPPVGRAPHGHQGC